MNLSLTFLDSHWAGASTSLLFPNNPVDGSITFCQLLLKIYVIYQALKHLKMWLGLVIKIIRPYMYLVFMVNPDKGWGYFFLKNPFMVGQTLFSKCMEGGVFFMLVD